ncbi:hypothetical protein [Nocardia brasiliensis]|uniref:hypothetical protein n=1 Tax=Nocardia brasiliensis TaxID=37326 RepID=UPI00245469AD|nr:hypothetical protein [Nocardia brasiliensis]
MLGIDNCLRRIMDIPGAASATLMDDSGLVVATAGQHPLLDEHENAALTTDALRAVFGCAAFQCDVTNLAGAELIVAHVGGYHLLRSVGDGPNSRLYLHAVFGEAIGNLAISRFKVREILRDWLSSST